MSLHPCLSFPLVGRGTETDSGEPLLWQLSPKWWAEGQPDVIHQWPPQSGRTRQKPIRWDMVTAVAHFRRRTQTFCCWFFSAGSDECSLVGAHKAVNSPISTSPTELSCLWSINQLTTTTIRGGKVQTNLFLLVSQNVFCPWNRSKARLSQYCYVKMRLYLSGPEAVISSRVVLRAALWARRAQHSYHRLIMWSLCYYLQSKYWSNASRSSVSPSIWLIGSDM